MNEVVPRRSPSGYAMSNPVIPILRIVRAISGAGEIKCLSVVVQVIVERRDDTGPGSCCVSQRGKSVRAGIYPCNRRLTVIGAPAQTLPKYRAGREDI